MVNSNPVLTAASSPHARPKPVELPCVDFAPSPASCSARVACTTHIASICSACESQVACMCKVGVLGFEDSIWPIVLLSRSEAVSGARCMALTPIAGWRFRPGCLIGRLGPDTTLTSAAFVSFGALQALSTLLDQALRRRAASSNASFCAVSRVSRSEKRREAHGREDGSKNRVGEGRPAIANGGATGVRWICSARER
jgi:hypothetical protein